MKKLLVVALVVIAILLGGYFYISNLGYIQTGKAYLHCDMYNLSTDVSSKIMDVRVDVGDTVSVGDTLVILDTMDLHLQKKILSSTLLSIEHSIASLRYKINQIKSDYEYAYKMVKVGGVSEGDLEKIKNTYYSLIEEDKSLKSKLEEVRNQIGIIDNKINRSIILSPVKGIVVSKNAKKGETVSPFHPIISLVEVKPYIVAYIGEEAAYKVKMNQKVDANIVGYSEEIKGIISKIEPHIFYDPREDRRYIKLRIEFLDGKVPCYEGMSVKVKIYTK